MQAASVSPGHHHSRNLRPFLPRGRSSNALGGLLLLQFVTTSKWGSRLHSILEKHCLIRCLTLPDEKQISNVASKRQPVHPASGSTTHHAAEASAPCSTPPAPPSPPPPPAPERGKAFPKAPCTASGAQVWRSLSSLRETPPLFPSTTTASCLAAATGISCATPSPNMTALQTRLERQQQNLRTALKMSREKITHHQTNNERTHTLR